MLEGVIETSKQTSILIKDIHDLMLEYKHRIRKNLPKIYSQDFINTIFKYPYTKIDFVIEEIKCHRHTASKYLESLTQKGFLEKISVGKNNYYINQKLCDCFIDLRDENK